MSFQSTDPPKAGRRDDDASSPCCMAVHARSGVCEIAYFQRFRAEHDFSNRPSICRV